MAKFYGSSLTELPINDLKYDPRTGHSFSRRWRGTPQEISNLAASYKFAGYLVEETYPDSGGYAHLRVVFSAAADHPLDQPLADQWVRVGNDLEKSLWHLPHVQSAFSAVNFADETTLQKVSAFKADVEAYVRGERKTFDEAGDEQTLNMAYLRSEAGDINFDLAILNGLIAAFARGQEAFPVSQTALQRTLIVAGNTTLRPSTENVNKMFTTEGMASLYPSLPPIIKDELELGYWLKKTPTTAQVKSYTFEIRYEWWFAEDYDRFVYGEPII